MTTVKFRKNGWLHYFAYFWADCKSDKTNICSLFWRSVLSLFLFVPLMIVFYVLRVAVSAMIYVVGTPIMLLLGYRPKMVNLNIGIDYFRQISRWPKIGGVRILPGVILLISLIIFLVGWVLFDFLSFVFGSTLYTSIFGLG